MLLASLNPSAVTATDIADAVRIDGAVLSRSDLVGAATSVAERVAGAGRVAILATPTAATVLAVTGCLIAGVPCSQNIARPCGSPNSAKPIWRSSPTATFPSSFGRAIAMTMSAAWHVRRGLQKAG